MNEFLDVKIAYALCLWQLCDLPALLEPPELFPLFILNLNEPLNVDTPPLHLHRSLLLQ